MNVKERKHQRETKTERASAVVMSSVEQAVQPAVVLCSRHIPHVGFGPICALVFLII